VNAVAPCVDTTNAQRLRTHLGPDGAEIMAERIRNLVPLGGAMGDPTRPGARAGLPRERGRPVHHRSTDRRRRRNANARSLTAR